ncbi:hypothetical protein [Kribbella sp. CA-293567]|uniref:hypothetical protein n=1 Tax=Kribbella sp. CA-293567 TaxID=3002436 RepID=UPI0022DE35C8|nr:hypothetical protein [Kribbella sp. CA-293567]WBQ03122.1 hypothetical protein OX958_24450 [Kribbella sp. CA-293567]
MKQHGDAEWSGHRELSYAATDRLYDELAGPDGRIRGLTRREYAEALDKSQAKADALLGAGLVRNAGGSGRTFVYVGLGKTAQSAYFNPDAQAEHFMASPYADGRTNLEANVRFVHDQLRLARSEQRSPAQRLTHLGAAAHALQDSYSGAHAWRDKSVYEGRADAAVESLHVFTPAHVVGIDDGRNTHADEFDQPPTRSGTTQAAIEATSVMLIAHEKALRSPAEAEALVAKALEPMLRPSPNGVTVNLKPDAAWQAERDLRVSLEQASAGPVPSTELDKLKALMGPHRTGPSAGSPGVVAAAGQAEAGGEAAPAVGHPGDGARDSTGVRGKQPGQGLARG